MKNTIVCLIILLTFSRCSDFAIKKKIIDNYYIIAGDDDEDAILSSHESKPNDTFGGAIYEGIIEATVFRAGYDDKYIIVEQVLALLFYLLPIYTTLIIMLPLQVALF